MSYNKNWFSSEALYEDDPELEAYYESDSDFDESSDDDESFGEDEDEAAPSRKGLRKVPSVGNPFRGVRRGGPSTGRAFLKTPAGNAEIQMKTNFVSQQEFKKVMDQLRADLKKSTDATNKRFTEHDTKNVKQDKAMKNLQQMAMLQAILQPKIEKITYSVPKVELVEDTSTSKYALKESTDIKEATTTTDSLASLMPIMMMGSEGGFGSGDSSMTMIAMVMAMQDKNSSFSDNGPLLMAMMMMGNK